eukprot:359746-Chlamydomonas_euryale.AAC.2
MYAMTTLATGCSNHLAVALGALDDGCLDPAHVQQGEDATQQRIETAGKAKHKGPTALGHRVKALQRAG